MQENQITCPKCQTLIDVREALYKQIELENQNKFLAQQKEFEKEVNEKRAQYQSYFKNLEQKEEALKEREKEQKAKFDEAVKQASALVLQDEKAKIIEEARKNAFLEQQKGLELLQKELDEKSKQVQELHQKEAEIERLKRENNEAESRLKAENEKKLNEKLDLEREKIEKALHEKNELKFKQQEEQLRNSHVKGIFTLGKKTNENLEKIESKKESINKENEKKIKNKESLKKNTQDKEKEEKDFTDSCWEKLYKKFEEDFKETLEGFKRKEKFKEKILNEFKDNKHNQSEQSEMVRLEELKEKIGIVFNKNQTELALLECNLTDFDSIENHSIWEQKIVGSGGVVIADLIKKLSNEDWVAQGREYVKDNSICPFCQKETITEEFKKQLESYFDTNYQESTDTIKKMKEDYTNKTAEALE